MYICCIELRLGIGVLKSRFPAFGYSRLLGARLRARHVLQLQPVIQLEQISTFQFETETGWLGSIHKISSLLPGLYFWPGPMLLVRFWE
jgi:hypothetical protein